MWEETRVSRPSANRAPTPFTRSSMIDARLKAYGTAALVLALDRLSKWIVESNVSSMDTVAVIPGLFNIVRSENRGMAFGIMNDSTSDWPTTLLLVLSAAAVVFVAALLVEGQRPDRLFFLGPHADHGRSGGQRNRSRGVGAGDGFPRLLYRRASLAHIQRGGFGDRDWQRAAIDRSAAAQEAGGKCTLTSSVSH